MNFGGIDFGQPRMVVEQLNLLERFAVAGVNLFDRAKLEANARMCKQAQEDALAEMAKVAEAQRNLDARENALNARSREMESLSQDLTRKENELNARERALGEREQVLRELRDQLRSAA